MSARKPEIRDIMVMIRMNKKEYDALQILRKKSTERSNSTYLRKVGLMQPVTVIYRNGSADAFLTEMLQLKKELNAIGNNFNQAVHKLHTLDRIPEFRKWIQDYGRSHHVFMVKMSELLTLTDQVYRQWLHA